MDKLKLALSIISGRVKPSPIEDWLDLIEYKWLSNTSDEVNIQNFKLKCEEIIWQELMLARYGYYETFYDDNETKGTIITEKALANLNNL